MNDSKRIAVAGWGLAGAILTWHLSRLNLQVTVYDSGVNHASRTAAGLVNPIVFKRLTKSWQADTLLPYATQFYTDVEKKLGVRLLSRKNIFRVFASVEEVNNWASKEGDERFEGYLKRPTVGQLPSDQHVQYPFGLGEVETIGNLDTNLFLDASKAYLANEGVRFVDHKLDYDEVGKDTDILYFFCEGVGVKENPFFNHLPLKPTHGETLTIESTQYQFSQVLNKNMFILAAGDNQFKVGATYNWELDEPVITEKARTELMEKLEAFTSFDYKIVEQKAGIRPTVSDRRPLLGQATELETAYIFNGLGTKGVMIGPYYAQQLLQFVFEGGMLDKEVDIKRFQKNDFYQV